MLRFLFQWKRIVICTIAAFGLFTFGVVADPRISIVFFLGLVTGIALTVVDFHTR